MAENKTQKTKLDTAKKRMIQNEKRRLSNKSFKSKVKTAVKAFKESLKNDLQPKEKLDTVFSLMDKGAKKNIFKQNKTDRVKSKLSVLLGKKDQSKGTAAKV